jgi:ankyrin repeat protein
MNIQSLKEFNGLYRVACHVLHEPQSKAQCKDISTCTYCRYSSIHNLAWSARYLKLEVFLSELKLQGVYDFCALDAAGNSALHYAAAGGAGYQHLKALIDVGVDPYIANTAGELFIYCLRPIEPFTLEPNSDCLKSDDLVRLLKLLQHDRVYDWRDNDGQTIMHALALKITEPELKAKIFM